MLEEYKTTDIILAACLKVEGYNLHSIEKVGNKGRTEGRSDSEGPYYQNYNFGVIFPN